jgi:hypothetical protein
MDLLALAGTVNLKAPRGEFAVTHIRPQCASIVERQIESPSLFR